MSRAQRLWAAMLACCFASCSSIGGYVWIDAYREAAAPSSTTYVVGRGDLLNVRVWNQEAMSARVRVRADGEISLPFLNDVPAAGLEPTILAHRLQAKLKDLIVNPVVTVALEEPAPLEVSVVGEVTRPGVYRMDPDSGVLNAIASASGLTQYARKDEIFVLRRPPGADEKVAPTRIRFTYRALCQVAGAAAKFRLRKGDIVVID